ncbi:MAG TPA: NHL repeat-containing protein [Anaeromyxobacter sp.]
MLAAALLLGAPPAFPLGLERIGEIVPAGGDAAFQAPAALWYDGVRDLLAVACPNVHRVFVVDRQGRVRKEFGKEGELGFPRAVAVRRDGTLYVGYWESESLAAFERYGGAAEEARTLSLAPHRGAAPVRPTALFAAEDGDLYVADRGNRQVLVLGEDGTLKRTVRDVGEPADVWVHRETLYVAEPAFGGVRVYDGRGKLLRTLGTSPSQFRQPLRPKAVAVDRSERVWVLEEGSRGIKALDAFGNLLFTRSGDDLFAPADLTIGAGDTLYVLEEGGNRIAVFRISAP